MRSRYGSATLTPTVQSSPRTLVVVPCYNEAQRLDVAAFTSFAAGSPDVAFLFVNDGSSDATLARLRELEARNRNAFAVLDLTRNVGKAEAVRAGLGIAFKSNARYVGYWDADLATPLDEIARFVAVLERLPGIEIVFGARVQLLGRSVRRNPLRHYLGRVFATAVSAVLKLPIYDTQCGAKLMRRTPQLGALFDTPFTVNWTFDVELLARVVRSRDGTELPPAREVVYELPLERWHDVAGSKVRPVDFFIAFLEIARIWYRYRGRGE
jgi:glycosyltransferase involved in cell wall biosynthesis